MTESHPLRRDDLSRDADWGCAIMVFERRIQERFLSCIEALEKADTKSDVEDKDDAPADCSALPDDASNIVVPGFAIVGLCCLLLETLATFRELNAEEVVAETCAFPQGSCRKELSKTSLSSSARIKQFLRRPSFGETFKDNKLASSFVGGVRSGIFHDAETRGWVIWREEPIGAIVSKEGTQYCLNRTLFVEALRREFNAYLSELRDSESVDLRSAFLKKMDEMVKDVNRDYEDHLIGIRG